MSDPVDEGSEEFLKQARRNCVYYQGRWVSKRWYRKNVEPTLPNDLLTLRRAGKLLDPDHILHVRGIVAKINTPMGEPLRAALLTMLDELHRLKIK
jgi:hypothetical protein